MDNDITIFPIGVMLREIRKKRQLSLRDVEKVSGISNASLCQIESGRHSPTMATLSRLAVALKFSISISVDGLLDLTEKGRTEMGEDVFWIVWDTNGAPRIQHQSLEEARVEAERLCRKEGRKFYILKCVGCIQPQQQPVEYIDFENQPSPK